MSDSEQGMALTEEQLKMRDLVHLGSLVHNYGPQRISIPLLTISRITDEDIAKLKLEILNKNTHARNIKNKKKFKLYLSLLLLLS